MHLLATTSASLDETLEPVDLAQPPGDVAVLSFADSDLAALAKAWELEWAEQRAVLPSVRLVQLRDLRHPLSVDLWIERVGAHAKVIVVRLLGGRDWWRYGIERLAELARRHAIHLAVLPGEDRDDPQLAELSTLPPGELALLLGFFREGGVDNLRALLVTLARLAGAPLAVKAPQPVDRAAAYWPGEGAISLARLAARLVPRAPVVPVLFYRSLLLAADVTAIDALCAALAERGLAPAPLFITSLKDADSQEFLSAALARLGPAAILTTTAFAGHRDGSGPGPLEACTAPVLQAVIATTKRSAWRASARGLSAADMAMHVVLPELDGRVLVGAAAFKDALPPQPALAFTALANVPEPDRVAAVADRVAALVRLQRTPRAHRRIAILMPDYPGAPGRSGYAVGLDVPASVLAALNDLGEAGYHVGDVPGDARALLAALDAGAAAPALSLASYVRHARLEAGAAAAVVAAWGDAAADAAIADGSFRFRARRFGNVWVALPPDRGRTHSRRADYHDAALPPCHALVAFGVWLRHCVKADAIVHMGAHGTLEWLPGKAVALSSGCFPEAVVGALPVIYPFIVSNPGEAAQAKRRIAALTIGHVPPPLVAGGLSGEARELERLLDEYAQADGLDARRRVRLARVILDAARRCGLLREALSAAGAAQGAACADEGEVEPEEALRRIDAWLCDLKDLAIKDGLHVYGRASAAEAEDRQWVASAEAERAALLTALDGLRVAAGPAGSPARGRRDVLPTGRNLYTADPRMLPTRTAMELGRLAADEVVRAHLQAHGEMPRAAVVDLWGSATLRTGGEEIAQGLALLGCVPTWDAAVGRVTGITVLPTAQAGRPRVDVTWRISGLFRDLFPAQIALIDAAVRAVAARDESDEENPLAAAARAAGENGLARLFGTAPGAYGAGIEGLSGGEADRARLGAAYLAAASYAYGGPEGGGIATPGAFARQVGKADLLLHASDDPGRDLLEGAADVSFVGGFAAAAASLGRAPDLIILDATDPARPRARPLAAALARIVRGRAVSPRFIAGQMRHGPRGAAELAETVDRLVAFAETTGAVPGALLDLVHAAYVADPHVRDFLVRENPAAACAIADRLDGARRRGLWHPRRNAVDADLAALRRAATACAPP
jgi:cobaltochelatase CobN